MALPQLDSKLPDVGTTIFTIMSKLAEEVGAFNLGQGFPDFDPPPAFAESLARHVREGKNQYAPMAGVPALRQQIAQILNRKYGSNLDADAEVTVTDGATEGIYDSIVASVRPGDEVIVFDPCYDLYDPAVRLQGGRVVHLPLTREYRIDWQRLRRALSDRTRLLVVNFPHNPSGAILDAEDLSTLAELLRPTRAFVLSDEVYEHIVFDGRAHHSLLGHDELRSRSFVVSSFGKTFHATGWKVGWVAAPRALSAEVRRIHQFVTFSTNAAAQHAFADLLENHAELVDGLSHFYQGKRDRFRELMHGSAFELLPVAATYFQLADYSSVSKEDDLTFCRRLTREVGVATIPLSPFSAKNPDRRLVRFCFCKNDDTLVGATEKLRALSRLPPAD